MNVFAHEGQPDIYRGFQRVLVLQHRTETALEVAEQGRAKAFQHLLATHVGLEVNLPPWVDPPSIYEIKQIAKAQNATLVSYSLLYDYNQFYQMSRFRLGFNYLYAYATDLYVWVVTPAGKVTFQQVNLQHLWHKKNTSISAIVRSVRELINVGDREAYSMSYREQLQFLYQLLIQPIADLLPKEPQHRVIIIPQDFLFLVPFAALIDCQGKYLIEKHTLSIAPAIQALEWTKKLHQRQKRQKQQGENGHKATRDSLIVANPKMPQICLEFGEPPVQLLQLPRTETEAKAIGELLQTVPLTGDRATKAAVLEKLPTADIIHLATHTFLDDAEVLQCAIAFAPSGKNNGLLTLGEILKLKLNAKLLVLSGCDISRSHIWGDGIVALSRAFIAAGVPSLVMSLWLPHPGSNVKLMRQFYHHYQQTGDKAKSLRLAMLDTMQAYPEPRHWAGFIPIGEAD